MALAGIRVIELAGLAPVPLCGMILADFGATVVRIDRTRMATTDVLGRGKRSVALNLKKPEGVKVLKQLCNQSDVLIEPFRKGVMEKLGLGPEDLFSQNPKLIYARLTGFGQSGLYSRNAGHDINYIAVSGDLNQFIVIKYSSKEIRVTIEGAAYCGSWFWKSQQLGIWDQQRGENLLDTGAPFYETYKTSDGKYMAVGALEPQFYEQLIEGLGLDSTKLAPQNSQSDWPELKRIFTETFAAKSQEHWTKIFDGTDACVTPVLSFQEAFSHPHNRERGSFITAQDGQVSPRPAPVLSRTPAIVSLERDPRVGEHTQLVLAEHGFTTKQINKLESAGVIECNRSKSNL
ncbi:hypothetical protein chiPu_0005296 [Chiloscyllium punctatum]|uniref:Alpha-methylacyl-CoA racemase n=1 Tax=Chiloscyllium punctatum TaxID=137246 RepID=A0A401S929_CHIPU|nr:hypothetical protein [Chiloscyllium punctatum]